MFSPKKNQDVHTRNVSAKLSQSKVKEILRAVYHDEAFYFYEEIGRPLGYMATGLVDFRDKINVVRWSSLVFHLKRKDFENWIRNVIGDSELAKRISNVSPDDFNLKKKLYSMVDTRIKELKETLSSSMVASEDLFVAPRFSETELPR